ncbi:MAG: hypothetical protein PV344_05590, partial [Anaplasma sp.]|nr:hypothetical protein [Anaplasma sp.]
LTAPVILFRLLAHALALSLFLRHFFPVQLPTGTAFPTTLLPSPAHQLSSKMLPIISHPED